MLPADAWHRGELCGPDEQNILRPCLHPSRPRTGDLARQFDSGSGTIKLSYSMLSETETPHSLRYEIFVVAVSSINACGPRAAARAADKCCNSSHCEMR